MIGLTALAGVAGAAEGITDHGIGAAVAESRGFVAAKGAGGKDVLIALTTDQSERGYLLVIDPDSGQCRQAYYPEEVPNSDPFASMLSRNGRFYTGAGPTLLEFDPVSGEYTYHGVPNKAANCFVGEAFADGPGGLIYIGTYPDCRLVSFDPRSHEVKDYGRLDTGEQYFNYLVFDSAGWAYAGIGTARCNLVAFNPATGERRELLEDKERVLGTGSVYLGADGKAYGTANGKQYRLFEGKGELIDKAAAAARVPTGAFGWGVTSAALSDGRTARLDLPEATVTITDPKGGEPRRLPLKYQPGGAMVTSLAVGPEGAVYGSSAHPMHLFRYEAKADRLTDLGPVNRVGGGNFCAMATQGQYLAAASYSHGIFHLYDTTQTFNGGYGNAPNPRELAVWSTDICRPRACLAHPDGRHILMSGFAGYGLCGGGLGLYDLQTLEATLLTHESLIPDESTVTMDALPDGNIVGGTSVGAPGGGHTSATVATLYVLDFKTRKVAYRTNPVPGATEITSLAAGANGLVYGLAGGAKLFVFSPTERKVVHEADLSAFGGVPRQALVKAPGGRLYAVLTGAILQLDPKTYAVTKLTDLTVPVATGGVYHEGRIYFAGRARLYSYKLPE